jgi:putative transposase
MKKTKFTESRIVGILKEQEAGKSVGDICRSLEIRQGSLYGWKIKYSGLEESRQLEV